MSFAESKLQRQNDRIREAEAALAAIPPPPFNDRTSLGRKTKPWSNTEDYGENHRARFSGLSSGESRFLGVRLQPSRDSSVTRSMSSVSHRTSVADTDRDLHESMMDDGFVVHTGRRKARKDNNSLGAYTEEPVAKQSTVEASFDKREILKVFGVPLPSPGYIDSSVGDQNGTVQFVQHPNGDVSAHQWSAARFQWENIGQFSNIRKRVEGQLAADRLKGQTGNQTLQMHTLPYFRAVAKQREANITRAPFGTKEINALLPPMPSIPPGTLAQRVGHSSAIINSPSPFSSSILQHMPPSQINFQPPVGVLSNTTAFPNLVEKTHDMQSSTDFVVPTPAASPFRTDKILSTADVVRSEPQSPSAPLQQPATRRTSGLRRLTFVAVPQQTPIKSVTPPIHSFDVGASGHKKEANVGMGPQTPNGNPTLYNSFGAVTPVRPGLDDMSPSPAPGSSDTLTAGMVRMVSKRVSSLSKDHSAIKESIERFTHQAVKRNSHSHLNLLHEDNKTIGAINRSAKSPSHTAPATKFALSLHHLANEAKAFDQMTKVELLQSSEPEYRTNRHENNVKLAPIGRTNQSPKSKGPTFKQQQERYDQMRTKDEALRPEVYAGGSKDAFDMSRMLIPVLENLSAYVQGPLESRRDYFCPWVNAPDYALDHGPNGNDSFFDTKEGTSSPKITRNLPYQDLGSPSISGPPHKSPSRAHFERLRFGDFGSAVSPGSNLDTRFLYGPR